MFEYICSICGASPEDSPLVADAVLGLRDGLKLLPCCEDCYAAKKKPLTYGKADQPKAQAAKHARKAKQVEGPPGGRGPAVRRHDCQGGEGQASGHGREARWHAAQSGGGRGTKEGSPCAGA